MQRPQGRHPRGFSQASLLHVNWRFTSGVLLLFAFVLRDAVKWFAGVIRAVTTQLIVGFARVIFVISESKLSFNAHKCSKYTMEVSNHFRSSNSISFINRVSKVLSHQPNYTQTFHSGARCLYLASNSSILKYSNFVLHQISMCSEVDLDLIFANGQLKK